jgi:hypothetical protein
VSSSIALGSYWWLTKSVYVSENPPNPFFALTHLSYTRPQHR